jgi:hypothetical protein
VQEEEFGTGPATNSPSTLTPTHRPVALCGTTDAIHGPLTVLHSEIIVNRLLEFLLAAKIVLSRLNRGVPK